MAKYTIAPPMNVLEKVFCGRLGAKNQIRFSHNFDAASVKIKGCVSDENDENNDTSPEQESVGRLEHVLAHNR